MLINIVSRFFFFNLLSITNRIISMLNISRLDIDRPSKDTVRIKNNKVTCNLNVYNGKQGDYFIYFCPSLNISGYGKTRKEAEDFLKVEIGVFCEDLHSMHYKEKEVFLSSLGFKKETFASKNFSKSFVDENGKLQDFEEGTLEHKIVEYV